MEPIKSSVRLKYTLGGILFGLFFPVFSISLDLISNNLSFSINGITELHARNVIHFVVDTAPIVLGFAGFLLGQSAQRKMDAYDRLRSINQSLDAFTFKITHDLRSPALNIKGLVDMLRSSSSKNEADQKAVLGKMDHSVNKWLETFKDFVELLKKEKAGITVKSHCDLKKTLYEVEKELQLEIEESQTKLRVDFNSCKSVYASSFDLKSMFRNLISNAIKYKHMNRTPEIYIQSIRSQGEAIIMIEDNGRGIDMSKDENKLFQIFERIDESPEIEGTGVGLYIVKSQVEKNGGIIEVASTLGEGTTFTITLPESSN
ncbi:MAG: HAMP domain-containing histidine kinase [Reichenbachiella sp.]